MTAFDNDNMNFDDSNPPEESSNRTFLIAAGVLGGLVLLGLLCLAGYLIFSRSTSQQADLALQASTVKMQFQLDIEEVGCEGTRSRRHLERPSFSDVIDSQAHSNR